MNIGEYVDYLRGLGKADKTCADYVKYVRHLHRWCDQAGLDPDAIPPHRVRDFADTTLVKSWSTRKQARTALAWYWRACGRDDEPQTAIRVPPKPRPSYRGLSPEDASLFRRGAEMVGGRAGLSTLCLLYTGARPSEVAGFSYDHIRDGMIAWWRPKNSDWQAMPLHPVLADALGEGSGYVFVGNNGREHVAGSTIWVWCRKVAAAVGLEVTPRQVRSTAGMMVLEATGDLDAAASFLGHRSVEVTRTHYVRTSERRMARAVSALDDF